MKALNKTSVIRLVARFDVELKAILTKDLRAIRSNNEAIIRNLQQREELSIA
jgi:hypothetical protein